ncbi:MAG: type II toxin-antitoxin system YoeB family toxin [Streptosporangiaceae bacterium]
MKLIWDESAWADYVWWQQQDRKVLTRISTLITDILSLPLRTPTPHAHMVSGTCRSLAASRSEGIRAATRSS